ncbi:MAG: hypothetical protein KDD22_08460 [Bdellovibrionales bacterium]|nr:hypothetical protein [Bdellovibrionales bacterium]
MGFLELISGVNVGSEKRFRFRHQGTGGELMEPTLVDAERLRHCLGETLNGWKDWTVS